MTIPLPQTDSRPAVLYVDDELKALQYFVEAFEDEFLIYTANSASEAYAMLLDRDLHIGVLLTDQRMPGERGVDLLDKARRLNPNLVRILVTAYTDYHAAIDAVNGGRIFRYIHKPWDPDEMKQVLQRAMEHYQVLIERERLLAEKAETIRHMLMADKVASFGILAEGLNHHLRNALTVISAFVDLAPLKLREIVTPGSEAPDPAFWSDLHGQTQEQIDRIQTVLQRLGEASQSRDIKFDDLVDLTALLDETLFLYTESLEQKGIRISHYIHPTVPRMHVNAERFRQLWRLLYADLLAHLSSGDSVQIAAGPSLEASGRQVVEIVIDDTGAWASNESVANLFDPFFVRSHQPHELGVNLTACYVIVHLHGGKIEAVPRSAGGLRIHITLPVDPRDRPVDNDSFFQRLMDHEVKWHARED